MTMRVTMLKEAFGPNGALYAVGTTQTVADDIGAAWVHSKMATDTDLALKPPRDSWDSPTTMSGLALVSGGGIVGGSMALFNNTLASGSASTLQVQWPALAPFYGFRLIYGNQGAAHTITAAKAAVAPIDLVNANTLTFSNVTFGGATTIAEPAGSGSGVDAVPAFLYSDYITTPYTARTDNPSRNPLVQTLTYYAGTFSYHSAANAVAQYRAAPGWDVGARLIAGDGTTTPSGAPTTSGGIFIPSGVEFLYAETVTPVAEVGDSLARGQESSSGTNGWRSLSERVCTIKGARWSPMSFAVTGQTHAASYRTGLAVASSLKPRYMIFRAMSANDGTPTQAIMDAAWSRTLALIEHCRRERVVPVVVTYPPIDSYDATQWALVVAQNARVMALGGSGVLVVDATTALLNPSGSPRTLPIYDGGDGTHKSDAAYVVMAQAIAAVVS